MTTERAGLREAAQNLSDRRTLMEDGFWVSQKEMRALDIALAATPDEPVAGLLAELAVVGDEHADLCGRAYIVIKTLAARLREDVP